MPSKRLRQMNRSLSGDRNLYLCYSRMKDLSPERLNQATGCNIKLIGPGFIVPSTFFLIKAM